MTIPIFDADGNEIPVETRTNAAGAEVQTVDIDQISAVVALALGIIRSLGMAVDPTTGRLRAVIEATVANQGINAAQINGVSPLMGQGASGTGSLRVTLASDSPLNVIGGIQAGSVVMDAMQSAWANSVRPRITT